MKVVLVYLLYVTVLHGMFRDFFFSCVTVIVNHTFLSSKNQLKYLPPVFGSVE